MKFLQKINHGINFILKFFRICVSEPYIQLKCVIIAGMLCFILSTKYQIDNTNEQNRRLIIESDRKSAEDIFNEVSCLMDDRHYKTRRLLSAYIDNDSILIPQYKASLILQMEGWNENEHRLQFLLESYFGSDMAILYMNSIQSPMFKTGMHIIHKGASTRKEQDSLKRMLEDIDINIKIIDKRMIKAIRENRVGRDLSCPPM